MKAEELRIGNWVLNVENNTPTIIYALGISRLNEAQAYGRVEPYKSIPLTEEWLKKIDWNGYKYLYLNSNFCLDESGHLYYHGDYTGVNLEYVHQLQNLYFTLNNKELGFEVLN